MSDGNEDSLAKTGRTVTSNGQINEKESNPDSSKGSPDTASEDRNTQPRRNGHVNGNTVKLTVDAQGPQDYSKNERVEEGNGDIHDNEDEELEEDAEDDDDDDEDDEEEPVLKYERFGGSAHELLEKDSASALAVCSKLLAMGTHSGVVHVLDLSGKRIKSFRPHSASVNDLCIDATADFVASASVDGQIVIHSLSTPETYTFDMKRPMRTVALEPNFAKRGTRAFICGGMAGNFVLHEKGWLGHKETVLHAGEGPIWTARWRGNLIAWANDLGVKIYDTASQARITYIDRAADSPRGDLFKCNLHWQDDSTLLIAWAGYIKVARIRARPRPTASQVTSGGTLPPLLVEITAVFQVDCMISGIVPHPNTPLTGEPNTQPALTSFLVLAYIPPDTSFANEATNDRVLQARKAAERPELRIISRSGEELSSDVLSLTGYQTYGCNDYMLAEVPDDPTGARSYIVVSPKNVVLVKSRDRKDHVAWLVERKRYEEALEAVETMADEDVDAGEIGQQYIEHLIEEGDYVKAAQLCPKVLHDAKRWENWTFVFAQKKQLHEIIPYVPTETPRLSRLVYEMILAHFLVHDRPALLRTIKDWPTTIYDIAAVIVAVQSELDRAVMSGPDSRILMECLSELYTLNRQPGKALPFFIRLRRPNVFDLIRDHNLFTAVQDQALLLVEFDQELVKKRKEAGEDVEGRSPAIALLVDHTYSIPVARVVQQLQERPYFLYLYLDALFDKDSHLGADFADSQVELYAEYAPVRLLDFLRASNYYSLEKAYRISKERDFVPEMVFLLGRMGNNKEALNLIIERLGDVHRAIDFAKEQNDVDLWEDLLRYSETKPAFIRVLLENVGAEIDPIRLIRRIKNGLEIPGLKEALIKILHDFNLQISLLEGCQTILNGDCMDLARKLQKDQTRGFFGSAAAMCLLCGLPLHQGPPSVTLLFLCRHVVHVGCVRGGEGLPRPPDPALSGLSGPSRSLSGKIAFAAMIRGRIDRGCPVCHKRDEGDRT